MNNSTQSFTDKVKQRTADHHALIEQTTQQSLRLLEKKLQMQFNAVHSLIDENTVRLKREINTYRFRPWIYPALALLLFILVPISAGEYLDNMIVLKKNQIDRHDKTLKSLGGVGITHQVKDGTLYLVLPDDAQKPDLYRARTGQWVVTIED